MLLLFNLPLLTAYLYCARLFSPTLCFRSHTHSYTGGSKDTGVWIGINSLLITGWLVHLSKSDPAKISNSKKDSKLTLLLLYRVSLCFNHCSCVSQPTIARCQPQESAEATYLQEPRVSPLVHMAECITKIVGPRLVRVLIDYQEEKLKETKLSGTNEAYF